MKTITIDDETHKQLWLIKINQQKDSIDTVIKDLLLYQKINPNKETGSKE
jgi:predicted CopG family antitoxin